jgi:pyrroloquinoline-quinone synthase
MKGILSRPAFRKALVEARARNSSGAHPFSNAWASGELTRAELGFWAIQHHYYIEHIPQQFGHFFCRLPDLDARLLMLENLIGEEMPQQPAKRHPELMVKFARACGVPGARVREADELGLILPTTRAMRAWIYELVAFRHVVEGAAGIMLALEGQTPTLFPKYVAACTKLGFTADDLEFFHVHMEADVEHQRHGFEITYRYAATPELQRKAIAAVAASAAQRLAMLDGVWDAIRAQRAAPRSRRAA